MLSRRRTNEWVKKKASQRKTLFFFYQLWSTKVKNKASVSKTTEETARKWEGHCKDKQNDQGSVRNAGLYTNFFKFKKKRSHWIWQRCFKKASPDYWITCVGRAPPLRWEQSVVTILSHLLRSCCGKMNSLGAGNHSLNPMFSTSHGSFNHPPFSCLPSLTQFSL